MRDLRTILLLCDRTTTTMAHKKDGVDRSRWRNPSCSWTTANSALTNSEPRNKKKLSVFDFGDMKKLTHKGGDLFQVPYGLPGDNTTCVGLAPGILPFATKCNKNEEGKIVRCAVEKFVEAPPGKILLGCIRKG